MNGPALVVIDLDALADDSDCGCESGTSPATPTLTPVFTLRGEVLPPFESDHDQPAR